MQRYKPPAINELRNQFLRSARLSFFVLAAVSLALVLDPGSPLLWGFIVGGLISVLNSYILQFRLRGLWAPEGEVRPGGAVLFNFSMRYILILVILYVASQVPFLSVFGVGAGLILVPLLTALDALITLYRHFGVRDAVDKI